jgi:pyruvate dehydrogenase E1 component
MIGATAGRTTLNGEGLQHEDGHSQLLAATIPPVRAYDPAYAYELATIVRDGIRRMCGEPGEDTYYYVTVYNENYPQPPRPEGAGDGIVRGLYRFAAAPEIAGGAKGRVRLVGSGSILEQVRAAAALLAERHGIAAEVYSATSWQQLRLDALEVERWNRLHPAEPPRVPYVRQVLGTDGGPVVIASDWMAALPDLLGRWLPAGYVALGTEGFGRSDTREALRALFGIDPPHIALAALAALADRGELDRAVVLAAIGDLGVDASLPDPLAL